MIGADCQRVTHNILCYLYFAEFACDTAHFSINPLIRAIYCGDITALFIQVNREELTTFLNLTS